MMMVFSFYLPGPLIISSSSQLPYSETFESGDEVEAVPLLLLLLFSKAPLMLLPSEEASVVDSLIEDGDDDDDKDDDDDEDDGETRCSTSERI